MADAGEADAVVAGAAPEANGAAVVPRNLLESVQVRILKLWYFLCLSGMTTLVNNTNMNIKFYTTTRHLESLRFRLKAFHTKRIDMRKLFAFREARAAELVMLRVEERYVRQNFVPEDFVMYKTLVFNQDNEGELICSNREVRWPAE